MFVRQITICLVLLVVGTALWAGPYDDPGVPGFVGPDGFHAGPPGFDPNATDTIVNPIFRGWATGYVNYSPAPGVFPEYAHADWALGVATGDIDDTVSLGDLSSTQIAQGVPAGEITFTFGDPEEPNDLSNPTHAIRNGKGYDFAVFENGLIADYDYTGGISAGMMFAELAFVEVSSNGVNFVRFPSVSLTDQPGGWYGYLTLDITDLYNLSGKHPNGYGTCYGTAFDLEELTGQAAVVGGLVDLDNIRYVRIVDVPGSGDFYDEATGMVDPDNGPSYRDYAANHAIYDGWVTRESGGTDVDAVGVLREQELAADVNLNGVVDLLDFALLAGGWQGGWGMDDGYLMRGDLVDDGSYVIDEVDLAVFAAQWLEEEQWRVQ